MVNGITCFAYVNGTWTNRPATKEDVCTCGRFVGDHLQTYGHPVTSYAVVCKFCGFLEHVHCNSMKEHNWVCIECVEGDD